MHCSRDFPAAHGKHHSGTSGSPVAHEAQSRANSHTEAIRELHARAGGCAPKEAVTPWRVLARAVSWQDL